MKLLFSLLLTLKVVYLFSQVPDPLIMDKWVEEELPIALEEHRKLASIPNDAAYPADISKNIDFLKPAFEKRDFEVQLLNKEGIPVLFAEKIISPEAPVVLFYLHMDGQPVDPAKWDQADPFVPVLKAKGKDGKWSEIPYERIRGKIDLEWRIFGRAAADDKGPIIMMLHALDIMKKQGLKPAINIKIILDGEEEKGSKGLLSTLEAYQALYKADHLIIMDGPAHPSNRPTLTLGCRGIARAQLTVFGARQAQHSGHYGNYVANPVFGLSKLLAAMKDESGRVLIPHYYDGIDLRGNLKQVLAGVPDDSLQMKSRLGIAYAEKVGDNYQEALQYPSLNIPALGTEVPLDEARTVVPSSATAKLEMRLVPESDGNRLVALIRQFVEDQGYHVVDSVPTEEERMKYSRIASVSGKSLINAFRTDLGTPSSQWAISALKQVHGESPVIIRIMGGTVPVTPMIQALGIPAVIVPMVNMDNNQHSPNENLRIGNMKTGIKTCLGLLLTRP